MRPGRVYGGRSEAERRAERRRRLLAAGLELFGTRGWVRTTVERLCTAAGVATRSFYEEYTGREQLLLAVYDAVLDDAARAVLAAVAAAGPDERDRVRAGVQAYVGHLTADPRRARVVHHEVRLACAAPEVRAHRARTVTRFSALVALQVRAADPPRDEQGSRLLALALTGAVHELLADWAAADEPRPHPAPLVRELTRLMVAALSPAVPREAWNEGGRG